MKTFLDLYIILLLELTSNTVSHAEAPLLVLKGESVQLDVQNSEALKNDYLTWTFDVIKWKFHEETIVKYLPKYSDLTVPPKDLSKMNFNQTTFALILKNLQETDTGHYVAIISLKEDKVVAKYFLKVVDGAKAPLLMVDSSSTSNGSCTVTCRGQNASITSSCDNSSCSTMREDQWVNLTSPSFLSVYVKERHIICNHSNLVSWSSATLEIQSNCLNEFSRLQDQTFNIAIIAAIVVPMAVVALCVIVLFLIVRKHRNTVPSNEDVNMEGSPVRNKGETNVNHEEMESLGSQSPTVYSSVGHHTRPMGAVKTGHSQDQPIETIYAQVSKTNSIKLD